MKQYLVRGIAALATLGVVFGSWTVTASAHPARHVADVSGAKEMAAATRPPAVSQSILGATKKFKGQKIVFYGLNVGVELTTLKTLAKTFSQQTGVTVGVNPMPASASDQYSNVQRLLTSHSSAVDVIDMDVIWQGAFAPYTVDLKSALGAQANKMYGFFVKNDTVNGHLVAMPWIENHALLYYRTDLLKKYHIGKPPTTWDQLAADAKKIQTGERKTNKNFYGFVFQGNSYEGLTCDALEWLDSSGAGTVVNDKGQVTVDNPKAVTMLNKVRGWVGTIAPRGVTTYEEQDSMNAFAAGDAAFLRNWLYAYSVGNAAGSKIRGKFAAEPLPAQPGDPHVSSFGGATLAVNKYSKHPGAAIQFVRYMTSPATETYWTVQTADPPSYPSVSQKPAVLKAVPDLAVTETLVARPSTFFGVKYNQSSTYIFQAVNTIFNGTNASSELPTLKGELQGLTR
jgi:trehalose/maltose transport system substrate-binding protein